MSNTTPSPQKVKISDLPHNYLTDDNNALIVNYSSQARGCYAYNLL